MFQVRLFPAQAASAAADDKEKVRRIVARSKDRAGRCCKCDISYIEFVVIVAKNNKTLQWMNDGLWVAYPTEPEDVERVDLTLAITFTNIHLHISSWLVGDQK